MAMVRLIMNSDCVIPNGEYIVEIDKVDEYGFHGTYRLVGHEDKYFGYGCFKWEHIFRMEKITEFN